MSSLDDLYLDELFEDDELAMDDGILGLGEVLGSALRDEYAYATPEELDAALLDVVEAMTPAESINFTSALGQIERGAAGALRHPALTQIAATGLPLAGGAAGTFLGGPAGTAVGSGLGSAVAKALSGRPAAAPSAAAAAAAPSAAAPATAAPVPATGRQGGSVASGSNAALKALILANAPAVAAAAFRVALGQHASKPVAGINDGAVMEMLSTIFGEAAADADELMGEDLPAYLLDADGELHTDPASPYDRAQALYSALMDAEDEALMDAEDEALMDAEDEALMDAEDEALMDAEDDYLLSDPWGGR